MDIDGIINDAVSDHIKTEKMIRDSNCILDFIENYILNYEDRNKYNFGVVISKRFDDTINSECFHDKVEHMKTDLNVKMVFIDEKVSHILGEEKVYILPSLKVPELGTLVYPYDMDTGPVFKPTIRYDAESHKYFNNPRFAKIIKHKQKKG